MDNFFSTFLFVFYQKTYVFIIPISFFFQQNANQSEARIGAKKLPGELYIVTHLLSHENFSVIYAIEVCSSIFITL